MTSIADFQTGQILCLEHQNRRLYAELIQVVPVRQLGWVRPLVLTESSYEAWSMPQSSDEQMLLWDLRQGADLIWPLSWFRPALDEEVIPVLSQWVDIKVQHDSDRTAHRQLQQFMDGIWQAHQGNF